MQPRQRLDVVERLEALPAFGPALDRARQLALLVGLAIAIALPGASCAAETEAKPEPASIWPKPDYTGYL